MSLWIRTGKKKHELNKLSDLLTYPPQWIPSTLWRWRCLHLFWSHGGANEKVLAISRLALGSQSMGRKPGFGGFLFWNAGLNFLGFGLCRLGPRNKGAIFCTFEAGDKYNSIMHTSMLWSWSKINVLSKNFKGSIICFANLPFIRVQLHQWKLMPKENAEIICFCISRFLSAVDDNLSAKKVLHYLCLSCIMVPLFEADV